MNDIITLDIIAARIAQLADITPEQARQYITLIKDIATRQLAGPDHSISIPHVGTFTVSDIENVTITYSPEQTIAETVNEPFSFFEAVPLCDDSLLDEKPEPDTHDTAAADGRQDVSSDITESADTSAYISESPAETDIETPAAIQVIDEPVITTSATEAPEADGIITETDNPTVSEPEDIPIRTVYIPDDSPAEPLLEPIKNTPADNNDTPEPTSTDDLQYNQENMEYDDQQPRGMNPIVAYILGILTGMILTCIAVFFLYPPLHTDDDSYYVPDGTEDTDTPSDDITSILTGEESTPSSEQTSQTDGTAPEQPVAEPVRTPVPPADNPVADNKTKAEPAPVADKTPTKVSDTPKTDTVGRNYYLATMSRKYYGRMEFWVYIYKENQSKLGHPDRIPVGTVVTIPPASKYDINPDSQASIDQARRIAAEIKAKYK